MVYIFLADGFEDMEALCANDILRRAGISVKTVGIGSKKITSAFGTKVEADISETEISYSEMEAVVLPGGMPGAENLRESKTVSEALEYAQKNGIIIAAICAAPGVVLKGTGVLKNKKYTCYPGYQCSEGTYTAEKTVRDGQLITGCGPEAAFKFAGEIVSTLSDDSTAEKIRRLFG